MLILTETCLHCQKCSPYKVTGAFSMPFVQQGNDPCRVDQDLPQLAATHCFQLTWNYDTFRIDQACRSVHSSTTFQALWFHDILPCVILHTSTPAHRKNAFFDWVRDMHSLNFPLLCTMSTTYISSRLHLTPDSVEGLFLLWYPTCSVYH